MGRRLSFLKGPKQQTVNGELGIREVAATMSRRVRHWEIVAHSIAAKECSGQSKKLSNVYFISIYVYMCIYFIVVELKEKVEETIIKQYMKKRCIWINSTPGRSTSRSKDLRDTTNSMPV